MKVVMMCRIGLRCLLVVTSLIVAAPVSAQDNLDAGKTPQQLFDTNCAICHDSARALGTAMGSWSLAGFLAQHYTSSRATADKIAGYLRAVNRPARDTRPQRTRKKRRASPQ
jgi:mono/diheme cytochrome c family protein